MKNPSHSQAPRAARPCHLLTIEPLEERRAPAAFVVDTNLDGTVANHTTLRQAIAMSNATPGPNTITFAIGSGGVQTITLASPLPALTQPVSIFGGSQTGTTYSSPGIILNGAGAGTGDGFDVAGGNSTIEGFIIQGFSGNGIVLKTQGGDEVINDAIGTNAAQKTAVANTMDGVLINNVGENAIQDCVISGNKLNGIEVTGAAASGNLLGAGSTANAGVGALTGGGNSIGTDLSASLAIPNLLDGILIHNSANNTTVMSNVVSANGGNGIHITGTGAVQAGVGTTANTLLGNFIGTDITGTKALGNSGDGIRIDGGANMNSIGDGTTADANVISANLGNGIHLAGSGAVAAGVGTTGNSVFGDFIGTDITGTKALGNSGDGVVIDTGANGNTIGAQGGINVISANHLNGVHITGTGQSATGTGTEGNILIGNYIGTDASGTLPLGNSASGVLIDSGANNNTIGDGSATDANVISANGGNGIYLNGSNLTVTGKNIGTAQNTVIGNFIGTDISGSLALGNTVDGILIANGASGNAIGQDGTTNVISANLNGVHIIGTASVGNLLAGNYIGTDVSGSNALGNTANGILIGGGANRNLIGDENPGGNNLISGNGGNGIYINGSGPVVAGTGASGNVILGNYIGTDSSGELPLPNKGDGILIDDGANGNKIGDGTASGVNVISANGAAGIELNGDHLTVPRGDAGTSGNVILGNYIGTDSIGSSALGNTGDGVLIDNGASGNTIGADGGNNVISANLNGIHISGTGAGPAGGGTTGNVVLGNFIGTDFTGTNPLGNTGDGVLIDNGANANKIGDGTTAGANVISGNGASGVHIDGSNLTVPAGSVGTANNSVAGNFIGTDVSGTMAAGNAGAGVLIDNGASGNKIGADGSQNVISANLVGVEISGIGASAAGAGTTGNILLGNYIGTDISGTASLGNTDDGILINNGANGNHVGDGTSAGANVVSDNGAAGIHLDGGNLFIPSGQVGTSGNTVIGNLIGVDATGTQSIDGNTGDGILINNGASGNTIGAAGSQNVISGNANGVHISGAGATGNILLGNYIGTDLTGSTGIGNTGDGILIDGGTTGNQVGNGTAAGANIISSNNNGVHITGAGTTGNVVIGNDIGTDSTGTVALGNANDGVLIDAGASGNQIGSATTLNVISGNTNNGVEISGGTGNSILGNDIGTTKTGLAALGNGADGVLLAAGASGNTIGGASAGARNVIAGNFSNGVHLDGSATTLNSVLGNYIGTDATGGTAMSNVMDGVLISGGAGGNSIGSTAAGAGNVISGNTGNGVEINGGTAGNSIQGNVIGPGANGAALGNGGGGVFIQGSNNNVIGGETAGAGNAIQFNGGNGVTIASGTGNAIQQNSIYSNGLLGIDLNNDGVTPNTPGGSTTGANLDVNYPVINSAVFEGATLGTTVTFTFAGAPNTTYQLELFASPTANDSGYGEGDTPLTPSPISVTTNASGVAMNPATQTDLFTITGLTGALPGLVIAGTATDPGHDTSEFSRAFPVVSVPPGVDNLTYATGAHGTVTGLQIDFSAPLNPASINASDIQLFSAGPHGLYNVPIKLAKVNPISYNSKYFTVTLTTLKPLAAGQFIKVFVNGTTDPVTSSTGVPLDGEYTAALPGGDGIPGGDFAAYVAYGTHITYKDGHMNTVSLALARGGQMEVIRPIDNSAAYIELSKIVAGKSTLSGNVKKGKTGTGMTTIEGITGLGAGLDKLPPAKFSVIDAMAAPLLASAPSALDKALLQIPDPLDPATAALAPWDSGEELA